MFRVRIRNEGLWRRARTIPGLGKLFRADLLGIPEMRNPESIDIAFTEIDLHSGVSKQTSKNRFAGIDEITARMIVDRQCSDVHDVGVSSGITSLELLRRLERTDFEGRVSISDKFAHFRVVKRGLSTDIFDADKNLVYAYLGPIAGDRDDTNKVPLSRYVFRRALRRGFCEKSSRKFLLLHPDVLAAINAGELEFIEFDIFNRGEINRFDFVRCMNLLNLGYFETDEILAGLDVLHFSMRDGGVLQVGRTHNTGFNHVGFYEKAGDGFKLIDSVGDGSEIDEFVKSIHSGETTR